MTLNVHLATASAYATFIECLLDHQMTVFDFIEETGLGEGTVRKLLLILKRRERIYVQSWAQASDGRFVLAVYALGNEPDAPKPPRKTAAQRSARRYAKLRLNKLKDLGRGQQQSDSGADAGVRDAGGLFTGAAGSEGSGLV